MREKNKGNMIGLLGLFFGLQFKRRLAVSSNIEQLTWLHLSIDLLFIYYSIVRSVVNREKIFRSGLKA